MAWQQIALEAASKVIQKYLERKAKEEDEAALANMIIDAIKQELNSVKDEILNKLEDLRTEELQGLVKGYLHNFELYKAGMPNELEWSQSLIRDANTITGQLYYILRRYLNAQDYENSSEYFAMYASLVSTYLYLLNEN